MADKKVEITNEMCRQAQLLIKGGATNKEAGSFLGVSPATVSRIRSAGYDLFKYLQNTDERRIRENDKKVDKRITEALAVAQVPGQMAMVLPEEKEQQEPADENKMMRFLAGKMDKIIKEIEGGRADIQCSHSEKMKLIWEITIKLDKLNDNLCQILRRMDK